MRRPTDQRLPISPAPSYQLESHRTTFRPQSTLNPGVVTATDMGNRLTAEDAEVRGAGSDGRTPRFSALSAVDVREPTSGDRQQDQSRRRCRTQPWPPVDRPPNERRLPQAGTQQIRVVLPDDRASLRGPLVPPLRSTSAMRSSAARTAGDDRAAGLDHPLQNGQSAAPGRSPCSGSSMRRPTDQRLPISPAPSYQLESHRTTFRPQSTLNPGVVTATDMGNRLTAEDAEVRGAGSDGRTPRFSALSAVDVREPTSGDRQQDQSRRRCRTQQWPPVDRPPNERRLPQAGTQQIRVVLPDDRVPNRRQRCVAAGCRMIARASEVRSCPHCDRRQRCDLQQPERPAMTGPPGSIIHFKTGNRRLRVDRLVLALRCGDRRTSDYQSRPLHRTSLSPTARLSDRSRPGIPAL